MNTALTYHTVRGKGNFFFEDGDGLKT